MRPRDAASVPHTFAPLFCRALADFAQCRRRRHRRYALALLRFVLEDADYLLATCTPRAGRVTGVSSRG